MTQFAVGICDRESEHIQHVRKVAPGQSNPSLDRCIGMRLTRSQSVSLRFKPNELVILDLCRNVARGLAGNFDFGNQLHLQQPPE